MVSCNGVGAYRSLRPSKCSMVNWLPASASHKSVGDWNLTKKTGSFTISTNTCIGHCFLWHAKQLLFVGGPGATLRIIYKLVNDHDPHGIAMMACHQHLQNSTDSMEQKNQSQGDSNDKSFLPMEKRNDQIDQTYPFLKPVVLFFMSISRCRPFIQLSSLLEMRWRKDLDLEGFQTHWGGT